MWIVDRLGQAQDDDGHVASSLPAFQKILAMVIAAEYWTKGLRDRPLMSVVDWLQVAAVSSLVLLVLLGRQRRAAFAGLAVLQVWWIAAYFPLTGNHRYLECFLCGLCATLALDRDDERLWLLRSVRWVTVVVLFFSGLQKLLHGYWFRGQFLAWSIWRDNFRVALEPLLPAGEASRLLELGSAAGSGPYLISSPTVLLLSNAVWSAEILLAVLLVPRRTRSFAWPGAVLLVVLTEFVARELMFGVEFVAALMLFASSGLLRRFVVPLGLLLALLVAMRLGLGPEVLFH